MYSIITILQGGEFPFFANSLFDLSLKIAHFKELLRANGSHRSLQKSESLFRSQKTNDSLEKTKERIPNHAIPNAGACTVRTVHTRSMSFRFCFVSLRVKAALLNNSTKNLAN